MGTKFLHCHLPTLGPQNKGRTCVPRDLTYLAKTQSSVITVNKPLHRSSLTTFRGQTQKISHSHFTSIQLMEWLRLPSRVQFLDCATGGETRRHCHCFSPDQPLGAGTTRPPPGLTKLDSTTSPSPRSPLSELKDDGRCAKGKRHQLVSPGLDVVWRLCLPRGAPLPRVHPIRWARQGLPLMSSCLPPCFASSSLRQRAFGHEPIDCQFPRTDPWDAFVVERTRFALLVASRLAEQWRHQIHV